MKRIVKIIVAIVGLQIALQNTARASEKDQLLTFVFNTFQQIKKIATPHAMEDFIQTNLKNNKYLNKRFNGASSYQQKIHLDDHITLNETLKTLSHIYGDLMATADNQIDQAMMIEDCILQILLYQQHLATNR